MKLRSLAWALAAVCLCWAPADAMKIQVKSHQQGLLSDGTGTPITGTVVVECRIYDAPTGGNLLYTEPGASVDVTNGLFDLTLGDGAIPLSPDVFASDLDTGFVVRYLEFVVNGEALSRVEMVAAPFAVAAHRLAGDVQTMPGELLIGDPLGAGEIIPCVRIASDLGGGEVGVFVIDAQPGPIGGTDTGTVNINTRAGGENGIIVIDTRPGEGISSTAQMGTGLGTGDEAGIIVVDTRPGVGVASSAQIGTGLGSGNEAGIIVVDTRPGPAAGTDSSSVNINTHAGGENGIIVVDTRPGEGINSSARMGTGFGSGDEVGIIVVDTRPSPAAGTDSSSVNINTHAGGENGIIVVDTRPGEGINSSARMGTGFGSGDEVGIIVVDTRPSPAAGTDSSSVNINTHAGGENGIIVVDTRPGEGISSTAQMGTGLGSGGEAGIIVIDTKPGGSGGTDSSRATLVCDAVAGNAFTLDLNKSGEINPCVRVSNDPVSGSLLEVEGDVGGGISPCVRVAADPDVGSSLEVELLQPVGIAPCVRVASDLTGALLTMSRSIAAGPLAASARDNWSAGAAAADSVSIEMFVDADSARMQLYAGAGAANTPIAMVADGNEARMGIGTSVPGAALDVVGDICLTGNVGACSDVRYKRDIHTIDGALDKISQIRGVDYEWRRDEFESMRFAEGRQIGVIAQDVEAVLPELVQTRADDYKMVDYTKLTAVLIEAMKELKTENEDLRARLERLEASTGTTVTQ